MILDRLQLELTGIVKVPVSGHHGDRRRHRLYGYLLLVSQAVGRAIHALTSVRRATCESKSVSYEERQGSPLLEWPDRIQTYQLSRVEQDPSFPVVLSRAE